MIHTVLLNPVIDHLLRIDHFEMGGLSCAREARRAPAGNALRVAFAVAALDEPVRVVGVMGGHERFLFDRFARKHQLQCDWVVMEGDVPNHITVIDHANHATTRLQEPGFRLDSASLLEVQKRLVSAVRPNDWVAFCGSLPKGAAVRTYREMIAACRQRTANILLDTAGRSLVEGIRGKPYAIKPNLTEFEQIFDEPVRGIQHMALKAKGLLDRGIENVFVSLGEDGLLAANSKYALRGKLSLAKSRSIPGCGDAMVGGFLVGLKRKLPFERVCALGLACGAAHSLTPGPTRIRKADIIKLLPKVEWMEV